MVRLVFLLLLSSFYCVNGAYNPYYCYATDRNRPQLKMFSAATDYENVRYPRINTRGTKCAPAKLWFYGRVGTRAPTTGDLDVVFANNALQTQIISNYDQRRTRLCREDAQNIRNWALTVYPTPGDLQNSGTTEEGQLAQRLQQAFPTLLPSPYVATDYYFGITALPRSSDTAQAFGAGLFGAGQQVTTVQDAIIDPYQACALWVPNPPLNPNAEQTKFTASSEFMQMVTQVSQKLGMTGNQQLTATEVIQLVTHCRYEQSINPGARSPFCGAFDDYYNHKILEYYSDLFYYYRSGYGYPSRVLLENLSCNMVSNMLQFFIDGVVAGQPKAKLYFGHSTGLQMFFVAMGLYEDTYKMNGTNYSRQSSRKWKTSNITPFSGNVVVVRFDCPNGDNDIMFLHNEKPLVLPGCNSYGICKMSVLMQRYMRFIRANNINNANNPNTCGVVECTNTQLA